MSEQAMMPCVFQEVEHAAPHGVSHPARLVVTVDKQLGAVGERVEVLPVLFGTVVMSYDNGCQVWLRSVDVQAWVARCGQ